VYEKLPPKKRGEVPWELPSLEETYWWGEDLRLGKPKGT
jgi:hypothetical protein